LSNNRNELFGRRGFQSATPENPYDATSRIRTNAGLTREEGMLREGDFLKRTEGQLDEFIGRGMAVLDNLVEQRGFLKVRARFSSGFGCKLISIVGCSEEGFGCGKYVGIES
jgi:hypothetical protein